MFKKKGELDFLKEENYSKFVQFYDFVVDDKPLEAIAFFENPFEKVSKASGTDNDTIISPRNTVDSEVSSIEHKLRGLFKKSMADALIKGNATKNINIGLLLARVTILTATNDEKENVLHQACE